ncbi:cell envelope biogenesis protein TolA [Bradyrhizobium genosp. A]|uniref:cell envelope biogenesis protein TolA n=1 Tax=Bradyrhizobium genosp. A TaxID=83626 RepID=UPI003CF9AF65
MARKLKTYQTSLGFFDQAIAAPSMKAALEAWGADHQGAAKQSDDPDVIAATMAKPGVVLKRPVGSKGPFSEHPGLPTELGRGGKPSGTARKAPARKPAKSAGRPVDSAAERKATAVYERDEKRRERDRRRLPRRGSASAGRRSSTRRRLRSTRRGRARRPDRRDRGRPRGHR